MKISREGIRKGFLIASWALYDLANQFFALNVVSLYFVRWLTLEKHKPEIFYSFSFGVSTLCVAALAPVLGAISDITQRRRLFLVFLTLLSVIFTMLLGIDNVFLGLLFFAIANFGCQTAIVFYNALMVNIAPPKRIGLISGIGKMSGYTGAILAVYLLKPIVLKSGYLATFLPTGFLFLIFALPCMIFLKDKHSLTRYPGICSFLKKDRLQEIFSTLKTTAFDTKAYPGLLDFLKAAFFGLCAVNAVVLFMSVYATRVFGLGEAQVMNLITFSTFFALAGSILSGFISDYIGHKFCLGVIFMFWGVCFFMGALVRSANLYWFVGGLTGFALGATWVVSRALAVKLVPEEKIGEVFGLFNLFGYAAAIAGSIFWGVILLLLRQLGQLGYRIALLSLILFITLGFIFLLRLPNKGKNT